MQPVKVEMIQDNYTTLQNTKITRIELLSLSLSKLKQTHTHTQ